jgi:hypothetical protein
VSLPIFGVFFIWVSLEKGEIKKPPLWGFVIECVAIRQEQEEAEAGEDDEAHTQVH